jgi:hypothetical protein
MERTAIDISNFAETEKPGLFIDKPGVYDITNDEYHSSAGISRSGIMEFMKTPFHYYNKYILGNRQESSSKSLILGSALHCYVLEPEKFFNEYIIVEKLDRRTKEGKAYYELLEYEKGTKECINQEDFAIIESMSKSLRSDKKIDQLISGAMYERSLYWTDPHTGMLCKCRPDVWQNGFIVDLKSSADAGFREFQRSMYNYGYHIQCAMIHEAFKNLFNEDMKDFVFTVVENQAPYVPAIYKLDELSLQQSVEIFKNKLLELKQCQDKNEWPGYKTQIITLPNYATLGD